MASCGFAKSFCNSFWPHDYLQHGAILVLALGGVRPPNPLLPWGLRPPDLRLNGEEYELERKIAANVLWSRDMSCNHGTCRVITRLVLWSQGNHKTCHVITTHTQHTQHTHTTHTTHNNTHNTAQHSPAQHITAHVRSHKTQPALARCCVHKTSKQPIADWLPTSLLRHRNVQDAFIVSKQGLEKHKKENTVYRLKKHL